jgi:DNA-binding NarL/FixJ family response regulator
MIGVVLVDDHEIILEGLAGLLATGDAITVLGAAKSAAEGLRLVGDQRPDIVLVDLRMPRQSGLHLVAELQQRHPDCRCVILTTFEDTEAMAEAIRLGACGFLLKDTPRAELVATIQRVHRGEKVFRLEGALDGQGSTKPTTSGTPAKERGPVLTKRESQILRLVATGLSNRKIAAELGLTEGTVKNYVSGLLSKFTLTSRTALALAALRYESSLQG